MKNVVIAIAVLISFSVTFNLVLISTPDIAYAKKQTKKKVKKKKARAKKKRRKRVNLSPMRAKGVRPEFYDTKTTNLIPKKDQTLYCDDATGKDFTEGASGNCKLIGSDHTE